MFRIALAFYFILINSSFADISGTGVWCEYTVSGGGNYYEGYYFNSAEVLFFDGTPNKQPRTKVNYSFDDDRISFKIDNQLKWGRYKLERQSLIIKRGGRYPDILATGICEKASLQKITTNAEAIRRQN